MTQHWREIKSLLNKQQTTEGESEAGREVEPCREKPVSRDDASWEVESWTEWELKWISIGLQLRFSGHLIFGLVNLVQCKINCGGFSELWDWWSGFLAFPINSLIAVGFAFLACVCAGLWCKAHCYWTLQVLSVNFNLIVNFNLKLISN